MFFTLLHFYAPPCLSHSYPISQTPPCQSHFSMLVTLFHVRQTSPYQSQSSMLVTLLHVSLTTPCQSHFSMLIILLQHLNHTTLCQSQYSMLVTLLHISLVTLLHGSHTTPCQSHSSMLVTLLNVSHTPKCQSHYSMLVTLLHVSHTPQCQSHSSMLVILLNVSHTTPCQSHYSMLVTLGRGSSSSEVLVDLNIMKYCCLQVQFVILFVPIALINITVKNVNSYKNLKRTSFWESASIHSIHYTNLSMAVYLIKLIMFGVRASDHVRPLEDTLLSSLVCHPPRGHHHTSHCTLGNLDGPDIQVRS